MLSRVYLRLGVFDVVYNSSALHRRITVSLSVQDVQNVEAS